MSTSCGCALLQAELVRIIGAACPAHVAEDRYTGLMVLDEAPW